MLLLFLLSVNVALVVHAKDYRPVSGVTLDHSTMVLERGASRAQTLTASIIPADASNKEVRWSSSNDELVQVRAGSDLSATVEGLAPGTATVTVITEDGSKTASAKVNVIVLVSSVHMEKYETVLSPGEQLQIVAWVKPDDATDQRLLWKSSNEEVADVNERGLVTAKSEGEVQIFAFSAENSDYFAYNILNISNEPLQTPGEVAEAESVEAQTVENNGGLEAERVIVSQQPPGFQVYLTIGLVAVALMVIILGGFYLAKKRNR